MLAVDNDLKLNKEDFELFRDYIHEKAGIFFANNKVYLLENRLAKRISDLGIKNYKDYFYRVKYDVTMKEFNHLMNLVTTNETSFFRNPPQLKSFSDEALPLVIQEKIKRKGAKTLKIWSAGCSTGEEPYTLAILVWERLGLLAGWNVEIIATDISEQVLAMARRGEYNEVAMRSTPPDVAQRYFTHEGERYRVKADIKNLVRFGHLNLHDHRKLSMYTNMDFIFCRNVMIYFSDEVKRQLVRALYNSLSPGGYFYIGHSESLHGISKAFKLVYFKNALVYYKERKGVGTGAEMAPSEFGEGIVVTNDASSGADKAIELLKKIKPMATTK